MTDQTRLTWFPKPMTAGDTAGQGQLKMLGKPDISVTELLVRETAQNSWDARLPNTIPEFELRVRTLDDAARQTLKSNVFTGMHPDNELATVLDAPRLTALEIVDRGTKGLGGPLHNDVPIEPGRAKDYVDFVLTVGAPQEGATAGGTYGFGKTASYLASSCATILIWTRTHSNTGALTQRFIGSAISDTFAMRDEAGRPRQFTGRQWWALPPSDPQTVPGLHFDPATDELAQELGSRLFERGFSGRETGTSILILQPKGHEHLASLAEALKLALVTNLWPKLAEEQPAERRMNLSVWLEGSRCALLNGKTSATLQARQLCLDAIRRHQDGDTRDISPFLQTVQIETLRPKKRVGHVALARFMTQEPEDPLHEAQGTITFMRSEAELVVASKQLPVSLEGPLGWVAVFKSDPALDPVFAQAEPPAHDTWSPESLENRHHSTFVRQAVEKSEKWVREQLAPKPVPPEPQAQASTGALSAALSDLAGTAPGARASSAPTRSSTKPTGRRITGRIEARIRSIRLQPRSNLQMATDRQSTLFEVELLGEGDDQLFVTSSNLKVAADGTSINAGGVAHEAWIDQSGRRYPIDAFSMVPGESAWAEISYPAGLAVDVDFQVHS